MDAEEVINLIRDMRRLHYPEAEIRKMVKQEYGIELKPQTNEQDRRTPKKNSRA